MVFLNITGARRGDNLFNGGEFYVLTFTAKLLTFVTAMLLIRVGEGGVEHAAVVLM